MCIRDRHRINGIIEGLEDRISGLIDEIDSHKKEMARLSKAITLVTVKAVSYTHLSTRDASGIPCAPGKKPVFW